MRVSSPIPHHKARIEIIPLIDIMFFLLASFMMVSLSQVHVKGIKLNLPTGLMGQTQSRREYVALSVDKDAAHARKLTNPAQEGTDRDHSVDRHHVLPPGQLHDGELEPGAYERHQGQPAHRGRGL